jgi:hypothetical protein
MEPEKPVINPPNLALDLAANAKGSALVLRPLLGPLCRIRYTVLLGTGP